RPRAPRPLSIQGACGSAVSASRCQESARSPQSSNRLKVPGPSGHIVADKERVLRSQRFWRIGLHVLINEDKLWPSRALSLAGGPRRRAIASVRAVRHRPPPVRRRIVAPHLRSLRPVLVPGARLEKAELLVVHLVHLAEEFDHHAVRTLMIDRDVVTDNV